MKRSLAIVAYVPVLHAGYYQLFKRHEGSAIYILSRSLTRALRSLEKDIRALEPAQAAKAVGGWGLAVQVSIGDEQALQTLANANFRIILPDEDISRLIAERFFFANPTEYEPIFLRWDRQQSTASSDITPDRTLPFNSPEARPMHKAILASKHSSDIWRRVGAVLVRNGKVFAAAYNQAQPSPHTPWIDGDPRNNFNQGTQIDTSLFTHAEALAVAGCARDGHQTAGADIFVTVFPCPTCARLLVGCGIKRCYYAAGYSLLDAGSIMRAAGIEIIRVKDIPPPQADDSLRPYPETNSSSQ